MHRKASAGYDTLMSGLGIDTIRMIFSYIIALVVVSGGGFYIYTHGTDQAASSTLVVVAGFMGSALTFVFGLEVQTRTARQSESSTAAATAAAASTTASVTNGNGHGATG